MCVVVPARKYQKLNKKFKKNKFNCLFKLNSGQFTA